MTEIPGPCPECGRFGHCSATIPADLGRELYEATEYFATLERGELLDWPRIFECQKRIKAARAAYEREVGK